MIQEFEGKTQKEAIDRAIEALGLDRDEIDIEILENSKGFLFGKGKVRIKVHLSEHDEEELEEDQEPEILEPDDEVEEKVVGFLGEVIRLMGYNCKTHISRREPGRLVVNVESGHGGVIIGRKGKNLDALQLLANVYAGRVAGRHVKIVVDTEDYRRRREASLQQLALRTGEQVRRSRGSKLLEAMNPFERRIIHTSLTDLDDVATISEGEGLYKKVRVFYKEPVDR